MSPKRSLPGRHARCVHHIPHPGHLGPRQCVRRSRDSEFRSACNFEASKGRAGDARVTFRGHGAPDEASPMSRAAKGTRLFGKKHPLDRRACKAPEPEVDF